MQPNVSLCHKYGIDLVGSYLKEGLDSRLTLQLKDAKVPSSAKAHALVPLRSFDQKGI